MQKLVWLLLLVLLVLHQDYWNWGNGQLVFGVLPHSLAYHCAVSLGAAFAWILAVNFCWPNKMLEDFELPENVEGQQE